jgi:MacB-like periplasmic core domain
MDFERFAHMVWLKFRSLFRRSAVERELNEELRYHVEALAAQLRGQGLSPEEARHRASREFGALEQSKEQCRDARGIRVFEEFARDTKYAFRTLAKQPAFSLVVIGTIAVGIAANAAIFGVVNSVLFRPLPFPQSEQLVSLWEASSRFTGTSGASSASHDSSSCSYPNFEDWRRDNRAFENMAAYFSTSFVFTDRVGAIRLQGAVVSAALFPLLRTQPLLGRTFLKQEDEPGNHSLILSYKLWQERFGGDRAVLGRSATLDGQLYTIVGVMPAEFQFSVQNEPVELWTTIAPYRARPPEGGQPMTEQRDNHFLSVIARLKTDISVEQAQTNLDTIAAGLARQYPASNSSSAVKVVPLLRDLVGDAVASTRTDDHLPAVTKMVSLRAACNRAALNVQNPSKTRATALRFRRRLPQTSTRRYYLLKI